MPGHPDPLYEEKQDEKGQRYIKIIRDSNGDPVFPAEPKKKVFNYFAAKPAEKPVEKPADVSDHVYSEDELWDMNKAEQVKLLKKLGLSDAEVKKLKKEEDRVDKAMELQG